MAGSISLSMTQQLDQFGVPLAGGHLYFIQAGTVSTPQNAFQDSALTIPWPNPVILSASGRIPQLFFADGSIKIRLTDVNGVEILVADGILVVGASSGGGGGSPVDPTTVLQTGWLQPIYGTGVVAGFVRANARTIGSATSGATERANADTLALYSYLWGADANLAVSGGRGASPAADFAANKTIALPDFRGRALAGLDDMGNSAAGRLTATYFGTAATVLGAAGGAESQTLTLTQIPTGITSANATQAIAVNSTTNSIVIGTVNVGSNGSGAAINTLSGASASNVTSSGSNAISVTSNNTSGGAHNIASPMMLASIYIKL